MKRLLLGLFLLLAGVSPALASSLHPTALDDALSVIRLQYPHAEVVGRFYDWRTVSIYRSQPGLHLGYDIALPTGAAVPAAWKGTVVAVTPWLGPQYGITVDTDGCRVTYGHLAPLVAVGQSVSRGQAVGRVCIDHVDIKMRDGVGNYVDFGGPEKVASVLVTDPRQALMEAESKVRDARARLETLQAQIALVGPQQARVQSLASRMDDLYEQGAVSHDQATAIVRQGQDLEHRSSNLAALLSEARSQLAAADADRRRATVALVGMGLSPTEPTARAVQNLKPTGHAPSGPTSTDAAHWQSLYDQGAISRDTLELHMK